MWLQCLFWFGKNGMRELQSVNSSIRNQEYAASHIISMKIRNDKLFAEINDLYNGYEAIEERARTNLCMIKKGEMYYRLVSN
nr:septum formation initiator family protein [Blochmannia endosymbiont of Camponotus (Colobopsis) obliquus]